MKHILTKHYIEDKDALDKSFIVTLTDPDEIQKAVDAGKLHQETRVDKKGHTVKKWVKGDIDRKKIRKQHQDKWRNEKSSNDEIRRFMRRKKCWSKEDEDYFKENGKVRESVKKDYKRYHK